MPRFRPSKTWAWIAAAAVFAIALPAGALAATGTSIVIVDGSHPKQKAKVTAQGRLATTLCGGTSCASVDSGSLRVGDGGGPVTVDGQVQVTGAVSPARPAAPWADYCSVSSAAVSVSCQVTAPEASGVVVRTVSIRATAPTGSSFPYVQCTVSPGTSTGYFYVPTQFTANYSGQDYYVGTIPIDAYIDANEVLSCTALRTPTTGTVYLVVGLVGYKS